MSLFAYINYSHNYICKCGCGCGEGNSSYDTLPTWGKVLFWVGALVATVACAVYEANKEKNG